MTRNNSSRRAAGSGPGRAAHVAAADAVHGAGHARVPGGAAGRGRGSRLRAGRAVITVRADAPLRRRSCAPPRRRQARTVAEPIIATVSLMAESGLPCFSRGAPVANLRTRFHLEMSDAQARGTPCCGVRQGSGFGFRSCRRRATGPHRLSTRGARRACRAAHRPRRSCGLKSRMPTTSGPPDSTTTSRVCRTRYRSDGAQTHCIGIFSPRKTASAQPGLVLAALVSVWQLH